LDEPINSLSFLRFHPLVLVVSKKKKFCKKKIIFFRQNMKTELGSVLESNHTTIGINDPGYWTRDSPVVCYQLNIISVYCFLLLLASIVFNTVLLRTFYKYKELRTTLNVFVIVLTAMNLVASISELPVVMFTNWYCRYETMQCR
jgi:hypothetical protein